MKLHSIEEILLVTLSGLIANCDGWSEIEDFARTKIEFLRRFLSFENGCPSDDTCPRFFRAVKPEQFQKCFLEWVESLKHNKIEFIAIDGKTNRGSKDDKLGNSKAIHIVSAFASDAQLILAQEKISEKSNEITAISILLKLLDLIRNSFKFFFSKQYDID
jgi:hypothetical protein